MKSLALVRALRTCSQRNFVRSSPVFTQFHVNFERNFYDKITSTPFDEEVCKNLRVSFDEMDVEVRPDGVLYLPDAYFRNVLTQTFKLGGWAIVPTSKPQNTGSHIITEYALFCNGALVSQSYGEISLEFEKMSQTSSAGMESVKNDALMKCCKDLGIASELWDPVWVQNWISKHTVRVWCENVLTKQKKLLIRRKDRPVFEFPWKELGTKDAIKTEKLTFEPVKTENLESKQTLEEALTKETEKIKNVDPIAQTIIELEASIKEGQEKWNNQTKLETSVDKEPVDMFASFEMMNANKVEAGNKEKPKSYFDINGSITFGKYKGKTWKEALEEKNISDYLTWLANKSTTDYLKQTGRDALHYLNKLN